jgi:type II secretory pathway pseudopilin PulG
MKSGWMPDRAPCARAFTLVEFVVVVGILVMLAGLVVPLLDSTTSTAQSQAVTVSMDELKKAWIRLYADVKFALPKMTYTSGGGKFDQNGLQINDLLSNASGIHSTFPPCDPNTQIGWRGPYIQAGASVQILVANDKVEARNTFPAATDRQPDASKVFPSAKTFQDQGFYPASATVPYGAATQAAIADNWGNPIVLQIPAVSADPQLSTPEKCWRFARLVSAGPDGMLGTDPNDKLAGRLNTTPPSIDFTKRGQDDVILFLNRTDVYEP